jgi:hypothetical protein
MDDYIHAAIQLAGGAHHPETGAYGTLHYRGIETRERANEIKRALFRSASYMTKWKIADVSMSATVHPADDGTFYVEFTPFNKAHARAYVVGKYGTDRSKWAYDPRARNPKPAEAE